MTTTSNGALQDAAVRVFDVGTGEWIIGARTYESETTNPRRIPLEDGSYRGSVTAAGISGASKFEFDFEIVDGGSVERSFDFSSGEIAVLVTRNGELGDATVRVLADETRPFLQGARLTAWELMQDGIDTTLIADSSAGSLMRAGEIDLVVVGSDRIAANGDTANKIGTYSVAVLAKENGIPFYVAAPVSTLDLSIADGSQIPIEERDPDEVRNINGKSVTPEGVGVSNPAFDVTPNHYVHAIITDRGIARPPFQKSLRGLVE